MDAGRATGGISTSGGAKVGEFLRCSEQLNPEEQQTLSHSQTTSVIEEEEEEVASCQSRVKEEAQRPILQLCLGLPSSNQFKSALVTEKLLENDSCGPDGK